MTTNRGPPRIHAPHPTHGQKRPGGLTDATIYRPLCSSGGNSYGYVANERDGEGSVNCKRCLTIRANQNT